MAMASVYEYADRSDADNNGDEDESRGKHSAFSGEVEIALCAPVEGQPGHDGQDGDNREDQGPEGLVWLRVGRIRRHIRLDAIWTVFRRPPGNACKIK